MPRNSDQKFSMKKGVLENFSKFKGKNLRQSLLFNKVFFIKTETLSQVFSCKFREIFKNTFFTEHLRATASECLSNLWKDWYEKL